jgi:hypothetical protein
MSNQKYLKLWNIQRTLKLNIQSDTCLRGGYGKDSYCRKEKREENTFKVSLMKIIYWFLGFWRRLMLITNLT